MQDTALHRIVEPNFYVFVFNTQPCKNTGFRAKKQASVLVCNGNATGKQVCIKPNLSHFFSCIQQKAAPTKGAASFFLSLFELERVHDEPLRL